MSKNSGRKHGQQKLNEYRLEHGHISRNEFRTDHWIKTPFKITAINKVTYEVDRVNGPIDHLPHYTKRDFCAKSISKLQFPCVLSLHSKPLWIVRRIGTPAQLMD